MSCFYVSARLRVCSSRVLSCLRALFHVGAWCSDPGTHVLSFGFVSGFGHSRSMFCLEFARPRALLSTCVVFCVARSSCFYRLRAFMLCIVLCGTQLMYFIGCVLSCCHVLREHAAYEYSHYMFCTWLVVCFAGHVLVFLFCVSTRLLSLFSVCQFVINVTVECILFLPCLVLSCQALPAVLFFPYGVVFVGLFCFIFN